MYEMRDVSGPRRQEKKVMGKERRKRKERILRKGSHPPQTDEDPVSLSPRPLFVRRQQVPHHSHPPKQRSKGRM